MTNPPRSKTTDAATGQLTSDTSSWRVALLARHPWLTYVLPLAVFLLANTLEPKPPAADSASVQVVAGEPTPAEVALEQAISGEGSAGENAADPATEIAEAATATQPPAGGTAVQQPTAAQPATAKAVDSDLSADGGYIDYRYYPLVYTLKIVLTIAAMWFVWPGYRQFPWRVSPLAIGVGCIGAVIWIALCKLGLEARAVRAVGLEGTIPLGVRSAFNPLAELSATPLLAYGFLAVRLLGLCCIVPVIEEFFLRGFVMRFVMHADWWLIPFGSVNRTAVLVGTAVPLTMHLGGEMLAAVVWFSLVTWLMVRTRNIWDCVAAHAVTNLLLGIYVIVSGDWWMM